MPPTSSANQPRRTMVLTGASRGIGHATVKLFSEAGWRIITCSRHAFERERCPWDAGAEDHVEVNLADRQAVVQAIRDIKTRLDGGPLHALINNAGISPKAEDGSRLGSLSTPVETWMTVFHVNFLAPILLARGLFDELRAGSGAVVNVTSIVGSRVHPFAGTAYATSKAALACLTRRNGTRLGAARHSGQRDRTRRNQDGNPVSPNRGAACAEHSDAANRHARRGREGGVLLVLGGRGYVTGEEIQINGGQHV